VRQPRSGLNIPNAGRPLGAQLNQPDDTVAQTEAGIAIAASPAMTGNGAATEKSGAIAPAAERGGDLGSRHWRRPATGCHHAAPSVVLGRTLQERRAGWPKW